MTHVPHSLNRVACNNSIAGKKMSINQHALRVSATSDKTLELHTSDPQKAEDA